MPSRRMTIWQPENDSREMTMEGEEHWCFFEWSHSVVLYNLISTYTPSNTTNTYCGRINQQNAQLTFFINLLLF
jgi:hypothetical protein